MLIIIRILNELNMQKMILFHAMQRIIISNMIVKKRII